MTFYEAFKAAVCQPAKAPNASKIPNTPSNRARATAMTFYEFQSCRLPACKGSKLPKFQTPSPKFQTPSPTGTPRAKATSPTGTPGPGHSNGFLRLSKLPFASPQTLQNSPNPPNPPNPPKPAKPSKHRPQQAPQIHRRCGPCPLPNPPNLYP